MKNKKIYAKTSMGFYIRKGENSINQNVSLFHKYQDKAITKEQLYQSFLQNNDLTEEDLPVETLLAWMRYLGWKA